MRFVGYTTVQIHFVSDRPICVFIAFRNTIVCLMLMSFAMQIAAIFLKLLGKLV